jgi:hypothetical protein
MHVPSTFNYRYGYAKRYVNTNVIVIGKDKSYDGGVYEKILHELWRSCNLRCDRHTFSVSPVAQLEFCKHHFKLLHIPAQLRLASRQIDWVHVLFCAVRVSLSCTNGLTVHSSQTCVCDFHAA